MDLKKDILLGFEALKLDRKAIKKVITAKDNAWSITLIIAISAAINALFMAVFNLKDNLWDETAGYGAIIPSAIIAPIGMIVGAAIIWLGTRIFSSKCKVMDLYKGLGVMSIISVISWIPIINFLAGIWTIVVYVVGTSEIAKLSKVKAFFALLIPGLVVGLIIGLLAMVAGLAYFGILNPAAFTGQ